MADSSNQYNPYRPGQAVMDHPCMRTPSGACISRINQHPGVPDQWISNPPPEESPHMQKIEDVDVRGHGSADPRNQPAYRDTIGTNASDLSRGQMLLPSAYDMPIVRRTVFLDTRYRDVARFPNAGRVVFDLETPVTSVSRIAVMTAKVPIRLADNSGMQAEDYVMMSIGLNLQDRVTVTNMPDSTAAPPIPPAEPAFARALAYVPLIPPTALSGFAVLFSSTPPYTFYTDFLKPVPAIERVEISWHRFAKSSTAATVTDYIITPAAIPPGESVYDVNKNATVLLAFYCKNRRPE